MMASFRVFAVTAALLFLAAGLGGCPAAEGLLWNAGPAAELGPTDLPGDGAGEDAATEHPITLQDVATDVASGNGGVELAWSYGCTTISVNPNMDVGDTYVRTYGPPYDGGWDGGGNGAGGGSGSGGTGGSGGDGGSAGDGGAGGSGGDDGGGGGGGCSVGWPRPSTNVPMLVLLSILALAWRRRRSA